MPFARSGTSYNPSSSSQKGHRHDYGRSKSVTVGQWSFDDLQINELCHSEADKTVLPSRIGDTATRRLSGHLQSQPEGLQQFIAAQRVPDPCRSVEKMHEFLPESEWRKNNCPPPKQVPKTAPVASSSNSNVKKQPQAQNKGKGKAPATNPYRQFGTPFSVGLDKAVLEGEITGKQF
ncbi:hypothetical protein O181_130454 [Austropuccinia psidii MF-1]|uniref:Uncharacterized protein n=1 Tax=Austropuccinia psidii MF-1 TaxID=1389203 RepID=A0A9Q3L3V9_9BASI|nr:hypothetical protein [Austropuccinia psidii MF-1]